MSYLEDLEKFVKEQKAKATQFVKQKPKIVKQKREIVKQDSFEINPRVKSLDDIPNTNIITSGKLIGIRLRADKKQMLKDLIKYAGGLINGK